MRHLGVQFVLQFAQHGADIFHMHQTGVRIQHFHEPAHVCALEILWQIDQQPHLGHGRLRIVVLVAHLDGIMQALHAHFIDSELPRIGLALAIGQSSGGGQAGLMHALSN